jgi:hypothetical protein
MHLETAFAFELSLSFQNAGRRRDGTAMSSRLTDSFQQMMPGSEMIGLKCYQDFAILASGNSTFRSRKQLHSAASGHP